MLNRICLWANANWKPWYTSVGAIALSLTSLALACCFYQIESYKWAAITAAQAICPVFITTATCAFLHGARHSTEEECKCDRGESVQ